MKAKQKVWIIFGVVSLAVWSANAVAADATADPGKGHAMHMQGMMHPYAIEGSDSRISLGLGPKQKQHQLANMRSHLEALQSILGMISENRFDEAAEIAHQKLGLTPEMQQMCNMFTNKEFRATGIAFHQSGDALGDTLKSRDLKQSLQALHTTMNYCIQCHATYRQ